MNVCIYSYIYVYILIFIYTYLFLGAIPINENTPSEDVNIVKSKGSTVSMSDLL
jgi:hypothetical protein